MSLSAEGSETHRSGNDCAESWVGVLTAAAVLRAELGGRDQLQQSGGGQGEGPAV